jgi:hypothetical protein
MAPVAFRQLPQPTAIVRGNPISFAVTKRDKPDITGRHSGGKFSSIKMTAVKTGQHNLHHYMETI